VFETATVGTVFFGIQISRFVPDPDPASKISSGFEISMTDFVARTTSPMTSSRVFGSSEISTPSMTWEGWIKNLLEREPRKHQIKPLIFASQKFGCYPKTI
jgi:hypothetical protein